MLTSLRARAGLEAVPRSRLALVVVALAPYPASTPVTFIYSRNLNFRSHAGKTEETWADSKTPVQEMFGKCH